jgi:hypothetical protein
MKRTFPGFRRGLGGSHDNTGNLSVNRVTDGGNHG